MAAAVVVHHRSRRGAGEHGWTGHAGASMEYGDAISVLNWARDGAEGGVRRWGGSSSHRRRWRPGVLQAGMLEGDGEVVEKLLWVGVVLLVLVAGSGGSITVGRRRGRTGGGTAARQRRGPAIPVEELEIGWLGGLRWVMRVRFVLRIGGG
jgi:hypothetical protein